MVSTEKTTIKTAQCGWAGGGTNKSCEVHPRSCALRVRLHPTMESQGVPSRDSRGGGVCSALRGQGFAEGAEDGGPFWGRSVGTPTLVVKLLQVRQVAQDGHAVEVGVGATARVLSQPQHPQAWQALQVRELGQAGDAVPPQVELTQLLAPAHGLQGRHAVDAAKTVRWAPVWRCLVLRRGKLRHRGLNFALGGRAGTQPGHSCKLFVHLFHGKAPTAEARAGARGAVSTVRASTGRPKRCAA